LERKNGLWRYSRKTAEAIPQLHDEVFVLGSDWLINLLPEAGQRRFLGLKLWQHIGILLLILLAFILHKIFTWLLEIIIRKSTKRFGVTRKHEQMLFRIARPLSLMILTVVLQKLVPALLLPISISQVVVLTLDALTPLFGMLAAFFAVDIVSTYLEKQALKTKSTLDDQLIPLVRKMLRFFVVVTGVLIILHNLNVNIWALLAGVSVGGLALALAAQDTIKHFFGSLMIFVDKPFQIGDWINFDGMDGTVEEVGFRSTRVRTFANSLVYVPNGKIADMIVNNYGMRVYRRYSTKIAITYDTPPELIEKFVEGLKGIIANHPQTRKDYYEIHLNDMGSHALEVLFYIFFFVPSWSDELQARHEVLIAVLKLADEVGVRFAFPTQTLHIEEFPEKKALSPTYQTDPESLNDKIKAFLEEFKARHQAAPKDGGQSGMRS